MSDISETIRGCRSCGGEQLKQFLDLGETPLADRLLSRDQLDEPDLTAPLKVVFCDECALVQITESVSPEILFCDNYPYYSSVSKGLLQHFAQSAEALIERRGLGPETLVMEAASNDGYMLKNFHDRGIPVLGVDPADGPAEVAQQKGIETLNTFFTKELARGLRDKGRTAEVFLANNVLAHVPDLGGFVDGIGTVLSDTGVAVIECPYLLDLVDHVEFDTIYHQHLCYFSVTALDRLFRQHGLYLNDVEHTAVHGGSLRLFVEKHENTSESVRAMLEEERNRGADRVEFYQGFADRVHTLRDKLIEVLNERKRAGDRIVGYGAAAKACTMMSYCGVDGRYLDYVVDLNERKHGRFMGGNRLEIVSPDRLLEDQPDSVLILAWNFADEIMKQQAEYQRRGGRFIVPVPEVKVVP